MNNIVEIKYNPSLQDFDLLEDIYNFLDHYNIEYEIDNNIFGLIYLKNKTIQLRYINSKYYAIGSYQNNNEYKIPKNYFLNLCKNNFENNIRTILIFDFELLNKHQNSVLKSNILTACGKVQNRIYARDCIIREIDVKTSKEFLNKNCFYGYRHANITLGLYTKKDIGNIKANTLVMVYSFGHNFYGNKKRNNNPIIEIIRVATLLNCQVIGGASKCLKHFLYNNTIKFNNIEYNIDELKFYVDASHNDARSMKALGFNFIEWKSPGFMNIVQENINETFIINEKSYKFVAYTGDVQQRKPLFHKQIKELINNGKIISVPNAGVSVWSIKKDDYKL